MPVLDHAVNRVAELDVVKLQEFLTYLEAVLGIRLADLEDWQRGTLLRALIARGAP